jgi:hypothetical protein
VLIAQIHQALDWQVRQPGWRADNGRYIPYPARWLEHRRWEDEPTARPRALAASSDWRDECRVLHDGRCTNIHFHLAAKEQVS